MLEIEASTHTQHTQCTPASMLAACMHGSQPFNVVALARALLINALALALVKTMLSRAGPTLWPRQGPYYQ